MSYDNKFDGNIDHSTYYIANTGWGGTHFASDIAHKVKERHDFTDFRPPQGAGREQWKIHRMDDGYTIKNVEHGSYLGFEGPSFVGSKEPFAWTVEPHKKDDGTIRFTIPNTDMYLDFASEGSEHKADDAKDKSGPSFGEYEHQSYMRAPEHHYYHGK